MTIRQVLGTYIFPMFLFLYSVSIGTLVDTKFPQLKLSLGVFVILLIPTLFLLRRSPATKSVVLSVIGLLVAWSLISLRNVLIGYPENANKFIPGILAVVLLAFILYQTEEELGPLHRSFMAFIVLTLLYSVLHYLVIVRVLPVWVLFFGYFRIDILRVSGIYFSPNLLGSFLIIALNYFLFYRKKNLTINLCLLLTTLMLILTSNRGSTLLLLLSWLVYAVLNPRVLRGLVILPVASLAFLVVPSELYSGPLSRALMVFNVLFGVTHDESFNERFSNNVFNLAPMQDSLPAVIFGIGHFVRPTDSDYVNILVDYGLPFLVAVYGLIVWATLAIGIPFRIKTSSEGLKMFVAMTTLDKLLEGMLQGGTISPGVAGYYFAFLGVGLAIFAGRRRSAYAQDPILSVADSPA